LFVFLFIIEIPFIETINKPIQIDWRGYLYARPSLNPMTLTK